MRKIKLLLLSLLLIAEGNQLLPRVKGQSGGNTPAAPTGVAATDGAYINKIGIIWDTMRNATGYQVFRNTTTDAAALKTAYQELVNLAPVSLGA